MASAGTWLEPYFKLSAIRSSTDTSRAFAIEISNSRLMAFFPFSMRLMYSWLTKTISLRRVWDILFWERKYWILWPSFSRFMDKTPSFPGSHELGVYYLWFFSFPILIVGRYCVQNQSCYGEEKRLYVSLVLKGQVLRTELHYLVNVKKRKIGYNICIKANPRDGGGSHRPPPRRPVFVCTAPIWKEDDLIERIGDAMGILCNETTMAEVGSLLIGDRIEQTA